MTGVNAEQGLKAIPHLTIAPHEVNSGGIPTTLRPSRTRLVQVEATHQMFGVLTHLAGRAANPVWSELPTS